MTNHDFFKPGIAAIALALLFPIYWGYISSVSIEGFEAAFKQDVMSLGWSDILFVVIGALEVYIYLSLRKTLNNQLNSSTIGIMLILMAVLAAVFHLTVLIDVGLAIGTESLLTETIDLIIDLSMLISLIVMFLYSLLGLIFAGMLIFRAESSSNALKGFGIIMIFACLLQLTVFLAWLNIIVFPAALILLAVYFLKESYTIEVI